MISKYLLLALPAFMCLVHANIGFGNGGSCNNKYGTASAPRDTSDAATQLIGYLNNPARGGKLHIDAMGANSQYIVQRQVGFSHAYLAIVDNSKPTGALDVDLSEVTAALELVSSSCAAGSIVLSNSQWHVGVATENHVGRRHPRDIRTLSSLLPTSNKARSGAMQRRDTTITIPGLTGYLLSLHDSQSVDIYLGDSIDTWSNSAESSAVNSFGQSVQDAISRAGNSADDLQILPSNSPYGAVLNLDNNNWSAGNNLLGGSNNVKKIISAATKATADQTSVLKTFSLKLKDPDVDDPFGGIIVGITIRRIRTKQGLCHLPKDIAPNDNPNDNTYPRHQSLPSNWDTDSIQNAKKRNINDDSANIWDPNVVGNQEEPSVAAIFEAIINNQFEFQYSAMLRQRSQGSYDGIVELTWLMGDTVEEAEANTRYQGPTPTTGNTRPDIMVVIHLHTNHILHTSDGQTFVGVQAMNVMHSPQFSLSRNRANVNTDGGRSIRASPPVCYDDETFEAWYPGYITSTEGRSYEDGLRIRLGAFLHISGYLDATNSLWDEFLSPAGEGEHWQNTDFLNGLGGNTGGISRRHDGSVYSPPDGMPQF